MKSKLWNKINKVTCAGKSLRTGLDCTAEAIPGSLYCKFHGGQSVNKAFSRSYYHVPIRYQFLMRQLRELTLQYSGASSASFHLYDELATLRLLCRDTLNVWNAAKKSNNPDLRLRAEEVLLDAFESVRRVADTQTRDILASEEVVNIHNLAKLPWDITRVIMKVCGTENKHIASAIAKGLEELKISEKPK